MPRICLPGSFNDKINQRCSTCSDGFISYFKGSTNCEACLEGEICKNGFKISCERGYLKIENDATDTFICSICPSGHYCPTNRNEAIPCQAGSFNSANGSFRITACETCPVGSYCPEGSSFHIKCGDDEIFYCPEGSALPKRYEQTFQLPSDCFKSKKHVNPKYEIISLSRKRCDGICQRRPNCLGFVHRKGHSNFFVRTLFH